VTRLPEPWRRRAGAWIAEQTLSGGLLLILLAAWTSIVIAALRLAGLEQAFDVSLNEEGELRNWKDALFMVVILMVPAFFIHSRIWPKLLARWRRGRERRSEGRTGG